MEEELNFYWRSDEVGYSIFLERTNTRLAKYKSFFKEAAKEIVRMSENADTGKLLRIFIEPGGCSGFEYGMSMDLPKPSDNLGESQGVQFAVDGESVEYLSGTEIHFDDGLSGKGFEIRNPNAQTTCGCGKSFS